MFEVYLRLLLPSAIDDDPPPAPSHDPMLLDPIADAASVFLEPPPARDVEANTPNADDDDDGGAISGPAVEAHVNLSKTYHTSSSSSPTDIHLTYINQQAVEFTQKTLQKASVNSILYL